MHGVSSPLLFAWILFASLSVGCGHRSQANILAEEAGRTTAQAVTDAIVFDQAMHRAANTVHHAAHTPKISELPLREWFVEAVVAHDWDKADVYQQHWQAEFDDMDGQEAEVSLLLHHEQYAEAREKVWGLLSSFPEAQSRWVPIWYDAWMEDPEYWSKKPYTMVRGQDYDTLAQLGGGSTLSFKVKKGGTTIAMTKPNTTQQQTFTRGEVAAFRLCNIMRCGFKVPHNREIRFPLRDFLAAYGVTSLQNRTGYSRRFSEFILSTDDHTSYVDGTLKEWVPGFTTYPLEHTDGWIALLNGYIRPEKLATMSLEDALRPMRGKERAYIRAMLDRGEETDALDFARQLSNLHVFDYLLNNWDRYSGIYWGVNCQWNHGTFVSIDNGAVLQIRDWGKATWDRLQIIRLFSKSTVEAIRLMDHDLMREFMFPDFENHPDEDKRFENFWSRRERFLTWIDSLIERYGEDHVLGLP